MSNRQTKHTFMPYILVGLWAVIGVFALGVGGIAMNASDATGDSARDALGVVGVAGLGLTLVGLIALWAVRPRSDA
jgi:hypothetical protein